MSPRVILSLFGALGAIVVFPVYILPPPSLLLLHTHIHIIWLTNTAEELGSLKSLLKTLRKHAYSNI